MYIVGQVKAVVDSKTVAWDIVAIKHAKRSAEKLCTTEEHFYFEAWYGDGHRNGPTIFPKRRPS